MTPISVVIITFNEERNIQRCLDSIKDIADEIVVVDSYSKDRTREICNTYQVKFIEHAFEGHIEQKNWAITQAKFPHILSLDADEALTEELKISILKAKENWPADGYWISRLTNYCGKWIKHSGWYPDRKLRLWDSRKGKWAGTNPHDEYVLQNDSTMQQLNGDLLHYSYYTIQDHYKQTEYFTTINANAYHKKGKSASILNLILNPAVKFIQSYLLKLGFMDGPEGFTIARISAYSTFLKYKKLRALNLSKS